MSKLSLTDLLTFAKAGYTPKDVKELLTMEVSEAKKSDDGTQEEKPASVEPKPEQKTAEPIPQKVSTTTPEDAKAEVIDYKAKCDELEAKMKKLQEQNTRQDISNETVDDPFKGIDDFIKTLM